MMKLSAKALSYYLTDSNTPIIGHLARVCMETIFRSEDVKMVKGIISEDMNLVQHTSWWAQYDLEDQWPNKVDNWAADYVLKWLPTFDWDKFLRWLEQCEENRLKFLTPPVCVDWSGHEPKARVVINGDVHEPKPDVKASKAKTSEPVSGKNKPTCHEFAKSKQCKFGDKCRFAH
jgi:hypothetical protein